MADNTYNIEYAKPSRAKCKLTTCKQPFDEGSLRIGKTFSSSNGERNQTDWFHVDCIFKAFVRARKTTKKIETVDDILGFDSLSPQDQDNVQKLVEEFNTNNSSKPTPQTKVQTTTTTTVTTTTMIGSGGAPKRKAPESPKKAPVQKKQKKKKKNKNILKMM